MKRRIVRNNRYTAPSCVEALYEMDDNAGMTDVVSRNWFDTEEYIGNEIESVDDQESNIEEAPSDDEDDIQMINRSNGGESNENLNQFRDSSTSNIDSRMKNMKESFFNDDNGSVTSSHANSRILTTSSYMDFLTVYQGSNFDFESAEQLQPVLDKSVQTYKSPVTYKSMQSKVVEPIQMISYSTLIYDSLDTSPECLTDTEKKIIEIENEDQLKYEELFGDSKLIMDISIQHGINFRSSFAKGDQFFAFKKLKNGFTFEKNLMNQCQLIHFTFKNESYSDASLFKSHIQEHLKVQLAHGDIELDQDFPYAFPLQGSKALHQHSEIAQKHYKNVNSEENRNFIVRYTAHLWKLFDALWGDVLELESEASNDHLTTFMRRSRLSTWFESYMKEELCLKDTENLTIYDYICAHQLLEASNFALKQNNLNMALIIVQMSSNESLRKYIKEQLKAWQSIKIDKYIAKDTQKMYALLGGTAAFRSDHWGIINVCEDFSWLQSYALHLWYLTPSQSTIGDVTNEFQNAFEDENYAAAPQPSYTQQHSSSIIHQSNVVEVYDLYYHLLRLFADSSYQMEKILNPTNYTPDPMDYSLSWFTLKNLKALGYINIREDVEDKIHECFASQLEREGLWEWAIFVLLHIKSIHERRSMVMNVIYRNVSNDKDDFDYSLKEQFVLHQLSIPSIYFSQAKSFKAMSNGTHNTTLSHFIGANNRTMIPQIFWEYIGLR